MKKQLKIKCVSYLAVACALVVTAPIIQTAKADVTAPVGYVNLTFKAESDTPFSLPLNRPKVYAGQATGISGNTINFANGDLTPNQYVYADVTQNEKFYLLVTTGVLEGRSFDVTANEAGSITVDPDGDTDILTTIKKLDPSEDALKPNFEIRPHWTLNTLFPDGTNFPASANNNLPQGRLMWRTSDKNTATDIGVNISLSNSYFFFDNGNESLKGWYPSGSFTKSPDDVLRRDIMYVYRNSSTIEYALSLVGDVPLTDSNLTVKILSDEIRQDNYMTLPFPVDTSLAESGILSMPGFIKSTGNPNLPNGDIVQVYAYPSLGINPAPVAQYIYFDADGTTNDAWYRIGNVSPGKSVDDVKIFKAGAGYVIRKSVDLENTAPLKSELPYEPFAP